MSVTNKKFISKCLPIFWLCIALSIYAFLLFHKLSNPNYIFEGDTLSLLPSYSYQYSGIARGEYPLWNPLARAGETEESYHALFIANPISNITFATSILFGVKDIVFVYGVYLFICITIYVLGVYFLVASWTQNCNAGAFASIVAIGSSSVFYSLFYLQFILLVHTIPWILFAVTMYFRNFKFKYLIIFAMAFCVGLYSYIFAMGLAYLLFLFLSTLIFFYKQLVEKLRMLKTIPTFHFIAFGSIFIIFILPQIFMFITYETKLISLHKVSDIVVSDDYKLMYQVGKFPRAVLELISPRWWITLFTKSYVPAYHIMELCVGPIPFPFLVIALFSLRRSVWCIAVSGILIGLLANQLFPCKLLYYLPVIRYVRNGTFFGQFILFTLVVLSGIGFNLVTKNNSKHYGKAFNITATFLLFLSLFMLLFSGYFYYEFNIYNIAALLITGITLLLILFVVNYFPNKLINTAIIVIAVVVTTSFSIFINQLADISGGVYSHVDMTKVRNREDHSLTFLYERPDHVKVGNPLLGCFKGDNLTILDDKFASLINLKDNSYKTISMGGPSTCIGSFKRYHLFIRLPGYEQVMRKKFFFFDRCFVSEEPKDMMAFKHDPELFTSVLARNIGIVDSIENDFGKVSSGKFKPESVSSIPVAGVGDIFTADVKEYNANNIKITVKANKEGLFTYTDLWDDGWHVRLDGKNAPLKKVFHTFKGVFLTPGVHEVEFFYRNKTLVSILVMNVAFAVCFLGLISYLLLNLRKKFNTVC